MRGAAISALLPAAAAHFTMLQPTPWFDAGGRIGRKPGAQCAMGCSGKQAPGQLEAAQYCACEWYTNNTHIPGAAVLPASLRTYTDAISQLIQSKNPWKAPGTAPLVSPCGVDGGNPKGCPAGNPSPAGCAGGGYGYGPDARTFAFPDVVATEWKAGSVQVAAWSITANHGGGYSYRLCKKPAGGNAALTEECFQQTVLKAADDVHTVQYENGTRATFPAVRFTEHTAPAGAQWTRNPIPACSGPGGGSLVGSGSRCKGYQFPPPLGSSEPGKAVMGGFGNNDGDGGHHPGGIFYWSVEDRLQVPADLAPGAYVLSLRWDCEQTSQVWNTCSDIKIV